MPQDGLHYGRYETEHVCFLDVSVEIDFILGVKNQDNDQRN